MNFSEIPWIVEHIKLYRSDPEKAHMWDSSVAGGPGPLPTLLLTTRGRKSGEARPIPLLYRQVGDAYAVIASKGGMPAHPHWYLNLLANTECQLMVGPRAVTARARTVEGEERDGVWALMCEMYPPYESYQAATERKIPVVLLDPLP